MELRIRRSQPADARALDRLAQLDEARYEGGSYLVAEVGDELWAALPVPGGPGFADPFRRSGPTIELLEMRRAQIQAATVVPKLSRARRVARRLRRYRGPASA